MGLFDSLNRYDNGRYVDYILNSEHSTKSEDFYIVTGLNGPAFELTMSKYTGALIIFISTVLHRSSRPQYVVGDAHYITVYDTANRGITVVNSTTIIISLTDTTDLIITSDRNYITVPETNKNKPLIYNCVSRQLVNNSQYNVLIRPNQLIACQPTLYACPVAMLNQSAITDRSTATVFLQKVSTAHLPNVIAALNQLDLRRYPNCIFVLMTELNSTQALFYLTRFKSPSSVLRFPYPGGQAFLVPFNSSVISMTFTPESHFYAALGNAGFTYDVVAEKVDKIQNVTVTWTQLFSEISLAQATVVSVPTSDSIKFPILNETNVEAIKAGPTTVSIVVPDTSFSSFMLLANISTVMTALQRYVALANNSPVAVAVLVDCPQAMIPPRELFSEIFVYNTRRIYVAQFISPSNSFATIRRFTFDYSSLNGSFAIKWNSITVYDLVGRKIMLTSNITKADDIFDNFTAANAYVNTQIF